VPAGQPVGPPPAPTPAGATQHPLSPLSSEGVDKVLVLCHTPESVGGRRQFKLPQTSCIHFSGDVSHLPPPPERCRWLCHRAGVRRWPGWCPPSPSGPHPRDPVGPPSESPTPSHAPSLAIHSIFLELQWRPSASLLSRASEASKAPIATPFFSRFGILSLHLSFPGQLPIPFRYCALSNVFRDTSIFKVFKIPISYNAI